MFARNRGFSTVVVLTLAMGIGANTAVFTLMDALMLRWLPVPKPQQLMQLTFRSDRGTSGDLAVSFSYPMVRALAGQRDIFASLAGFSGSAFEIGSPGSISRVPGAMVTGGYYETLGLAPVVGRLLASSDDRPGSPPVAVISDGYWERRYARNPSVIGERLLVNGVPVTIAGVSPPGFVGAQVGSVADVTMTVATLPVIKPDNAALLERGNFWLRILARLKPHVSPPEAEARLATVWPQLWNEVIPQHWPAEQRKSIEDAVFTLSAGGTGWTYLRQIYTKPLTVLMAMVALVLLIACANVASLMLARASARQREIAVRLAIGAGRGRIVRQLLIESMLLSLAGAVCGVGIAWISTRYLLNLISTGGPRLVFDLTPNWHVLGFTGAVAIATGVLFGAAPALLATRAAPSSALKEDARISSSRSRLLPWLVGAQVALSLVLLVGAGLFVTTLRNLENLDPGFRSDGVLVVDLEPQTIELTRQLLDDVQALPSVVSASVSTHTPLSGSIWSEPAVPLGQPLPERDTAVFVGAGPRFFATMQTPLLAGREFVPGDSEETAAVAVVSRMFAERHYANQNPVGQHLSAKVRGRAKELEIVGVVGDVRAVGLRKAPPEAVYVAYAQLGGGNFPVYPTIEIRSAGALAPLALSVRQALQRRLPDATIEVRSFSAQVDATLVQERMMAALGAAFGLLALVVASVGIYGLLAYSVVTRTREMGIRVALGARRRQVVAHVIGGAARLVLFGVTAGVLIAWATSRLVESMLFEVKPTNPAAIAGAVALLLAAALLAAWLPADRAARTDPLVALRHE